MANFEEAIDRLAILCLLWCMAKILLVEDEDFIRQLYKRQFEKAGFVIEDFASGKTGLTAALQNKYDLILLDIMLPDVNGIDILKQIKESQTVGKTPVVMLTNLGQDDVIKEGFKFGATGYLIKAAYTPDQVVQEVSNILTQQQASLPTTTPSTAVSVAAPAPQVQPQQPVTQPQVQPAATQPQS